MAIQNIEITHTNSISLVLNFCPSAPSGIAASAFEVYTSPVYKQRGDGYTSRWRLETAGPGPANGVYTTAVQMAAGDRILCRGASQQSGTVTEYLLVGANTTVLGTQVIGTKARIDIPLGSARITSKEQQLSESCDVGYPNRRFKYIVATVDGTASKTVLEGYIDVTRKIADTPDPEQLRVCGVSVTRN